MTLPIYKAVDFAQENSTCYMHPYVTRSKWTNLVPHGNEKRIKMLGEIKLMSDVVLEMFCN